LVKVIISLIILMNYYKVRPVDGSFRKSKSTVSVIRPMQY
jgi:hypothetical protein